MEKFTDRQIEIMEAATARIDKYGIQNLTIKTLAADIGLSEPALYRHFNSKNDILAGMLDYFILEMRDRIMSISKEPGESSSDELRSIFTSQLKTFTNKPAIVSVIFAESIFHFNVELTGKVSEIMSMMHEYVRANVKRGQELGEYSKMINSPTITTIIIGAMRLTVLKWKLSGNKSNLIKDGNSVLSGVLKMIENK